MAVTGVVFSIIFIVLQLIPIPWLSGVHFGKESYRMLPLENPPYYGCRQGATVLCTLDGLRINAKMQVLDTEGNPIEGLYSAGDCSGGFFAHNYPEYIVGVAIGRTLTEGYLLGDELAKA